jgi:hypothetical protein
VYGSCKEEYGRVKGTGASCSPPLHSSVREDYRSFWCAVSALVNDAKIRHEANERIDGKGASSMF